MSAWLLVMLGGAMGAGLRYGVALWLAPVSTQFPWATLLVNALGSFAIGALAATFARGEVDPNGLLKALLITGVLGGFTTFSTFSLETLKLLQAGSIASAMTNVLLSLLLCIGGCWLGWLSFSRLANFLQN